MTDYISRGATQDELIALLCEFPLAPIYRDNRNRFFRPDGKIHGVILTTPRTVFYVTPHDTALWLQAYELNLTLFPA
jgi:hypothetical protein